jgi:hypothetical protein
VQRQADQLSESLQRSGKGVEGLRRRGEEQAAQLQRVAKVLAAAAHERPTAAVVQGMIQVRLHRTGRPCVWGGGGLRGLWGGGG